MTRTSVAAATGGAIIHGSRLRATRLLPSGCQRQAQHELVLHSAAVPRLVTQPSSSSIARRHLRPALVYTRGDASDYGLLSRRGLPQISGAPRRAVQRPHPGGGPLACAAWSSLPATLFATVLQTVRLFCNHTEEGQRNLSP